MFAWMTSLEFVSQAAHFFCGWALLLTAYVYGETTATVVSVLFVAYAALKEFWFDPRYETPPQTLGDGLVDFLFYILGGTTGLTVGYSTVLFAY